MKGCQWNVWAQLSLVMKHFFLHVTKEIVTYTEFGVWEVLCECSSQQFLRVRKKEMITCAEFGA